MKAEIRAWVAEGRTDEEIVAAYVERHGARILAEPEGPAGWWLRAAPILFVVAGMVTVVLVIRRWLGPH